MFQQILSILAFCSLAMAAFGLGRAILQGLGVGWEDRLSTFVWSMALGFLAAGELLLLLGLLGILYVPVIGVITMAGCFWVLGKILRHYLRVAEQKAFPSPGAAAKPPEEPEQPPWAPPPRWLARGILAAAVAACLGSLVGALAPPTAGDALCYHLELPKRFLLEHRILHLPYSDNSTFPLLTEIWYLWGVALDGGVCAQLIHWGLGVLLALATVVLATPILGRPWAWIAGAVVVLTPGINNQMTAPLNDVALAAMTTLALAAWWRAVVGDEGRRWFVVAGLTGGAALGVKYVALPFAAAVGATWIWALLRRSHRRRFLLEGAAVVTIVAVSVGGCWYARAAWHHGNPVFPFLGDTLGNSHVAAADMPESLPQSKRPLGHTPLELAGAAWLVTMQPERFGGRAHQLGVVLLAGLPGVLFVRRLRGLGTLLAVASAYGVLWYLLRQNVRFLFPVVPLLSVVVVWVWIETRRFPAQPRWIVAATTAVVLAAMAAVPLVRARDQLAVAVGWEERGEYLLRHEPTYSASVVANLLLAPDAHILSQEHRAFYFDRRVTRENIYRRQTQYDRSITDPGDLSQRLSDAGFTHLLLAETVAGNGVRYDPTLSRLADAQWATDAADGLRKLHESCRRDADGAVRRYRLLELR
ncbi:MAG: hypothetical protein A2V70_00515 [Planctomycetes bacterium RBG_13_63_9]|nr:MAG: hypothetical protein A2V70_00515 [Planctomycetes bacterium RBG_13_63_9]